jgi:replication factor C subunit 3/5
MILSLNAGDERGIDVVRNEIKTFASNQKLFTKGLKLIILDEADAMVPTAQFALRRIMETYITSARFCLICNDVSKIIDALKSRCSRFRFAPLKPDQIKLRLAQIVDQEKVNITESGFTALLDLSRGDMRKCLHMLQSTHLAYPEVNQDNVYLCLGHPLPKDMDIIFDSLWSKSLDEAFSFILQKQRTLGITLLDIITATHSRLYLKDIPVKALTYLMDELSNIEYRLHRGAAESLQLSAFVALFQVAASLK